MTTGVFYEQSSGFVGPGSMGALLLEAASGSYDGLWIPSHFYARFSAIFSGVGTAAGTVSLFGANTDGPPDTIDSPGVMLLDQQSFSSTAQALLYSWEFPVRYIAASCDLTAGTVWAFLQATSP